MMPASVRPIAQSLEQERLPIERRQRLSRAQTEQAAASTAQAEQRQAAEPRIDDGRRRRCQSA